jgi:hemerythrin-like metal-binding protein
MASLTWNHTCTVGVQSFDDQHGILLDSLNELRMALLQGVEWSAIRSMLTRSADLMRMHMESEERLLERHAYPGMAAHRSEQQRLLGRLAVLDVRHEPWQMSAVYELVEYLRKWFTAHTGVAGRSYAPWLQGHGIR